MDAKWSLPDMEVPVGARPNVLVVAAVLVDAATEDVLAALQLTCWRATWTKTIDDSGRAFEFVGRMPRHEKSFAV